MMKNTYVLLIVASFGFCLVHAEDAEANNNPLTGYADASNVPQVADASNADANAGQVAGEANYADAARVNRPHGGLLLVSISKRKQPGQAAYPPQRPISPFAYPLFSKTIITRFGKSRKQHGSKYNRDHESESYEDDARRDSQEDRFDSHETYSQSHEEDEEEDSYSRSRQRGGQGGGGQRQGQYRNRGNQQQGRFQESEEDEDRDRDSFNNKNTEPVKKPSRMGKGRSLVGGQGGRSFKGNNGGKLVLDIN